MSLGSAIFGFLVGYVFAVARRAWMDVQAAAANLTDKTSARRGATITAAWVIGAVALVLWVRGVQ